MKRTVALVALFILSSSPARSDPKLDAATYTFSGILFPSPAGHQFGYGITWSSKPYLAEVEAALPAGAKSAGRTQWSCHIKALGFLDKCTLEEEWPKGEGFSEAARTLLPRFQVDAADIKESEKAKSRAILEINLEDDRRMVKDIPGDCPPPFCTAVPPPPPPPAMK